MNDQRASALRAAHRPLRPQWTLPGLRRASGRAPHGQGTS